MKKFGAYRIPDNAKLAGLGHGGCYYYNTNGNIYWVTVSDDVQHFRLVPVELSVLKLVVELRDI